MCVTIKNSEYNTTDNGKITLKRYYLSQRITYNWIDSFMSCKSFGMRLAFIETEDEKNYFASMARRNTKLFKKKVFVDSYNDTSVVVEDDYEYERKTPQPCYSIQKDTKSKLAIHSESCNSESYKFLCEYVEVVAEYDDPPTSDTLDVKATFFTYIGNFGETSSVNH